MQYPFATRWTELKSAAHEAGYALKVVEDQDELAPVLKVQARPLPESATDKAHVSHKALLTLLSEVMGGSIVAAGQSADDSHEPHVPTIALAAGLTIEVEFVELHKAPDKEKKLPIDNRPSTDVK